VSQALADGEAETCGHPSHHRSFPGSKAPIALERGRSCLGGSVPFVGPAPVHLRNGRGRRQAMKRYRG